MKICYGITNNFIDVTEICLTRLLINNKISIPSKDIERAQYFGDHIPGVRKFVKMIDNNNFTNFFYEDDEINVSLDDNFSNSHYIEKIQIDQYYNNVYDYDRNIPIDYLEKLESYNNNNNENLNFDFMKNNIDKTLFKETVFDHLIPKDTYRYNYLKQMLLDILINKSLSFKCLKTNCIYRTNKSIYKLVPLKEYVAANFDDINIYIFDQTIDPFIVVMGNGSNHMVLHTNILFVFYYKSNTLYSFGDINHWKIDFHQIIREVKDYLLNNILIEKKSNAFMFGFSVNIGHSYWNDLSGFKFIVDMGMLKYIDKIIIGPYDYYYIKDYLIKNGFNNIISEHQLENINHICENDFLFKYNDMFMYESLKKFTIENISEYNNEIEEEINYVKKSYYPIITFNLRGVYRNLYNQEEVISSIINNLLLIYPNMYILFDGYIVNDNTNLSFFKSEGIESNQDLFNKSYYSIVNSIIEKINKTNFKSLIGTNLFNQLKWLDISSYGLMQLGAGSFNYTWTMNKKCIYVGRNSSVNDAVLIHTYHDFIFRENRDFTTYINPNIVDFTSFPNHQFGIDFQTILYFMFRDLILLEKHNFQLSQFENLKKYNIYQSWGLDNLSLEELKSNDNIYENLNRIKDYIYNQM